LIKYKSQPIKNPVQVRVNLSIPEFWHVVVFLLFQIFMYERKIPVSFECGLHLFKEVVYGKWKMELIYYISAGIKRPGELQRKIPKATRRVLDTQLKQLADQGLISKTVFPGLPAKVEYGLTELGKTLMPVIETIGRWGEDHREELEKVVNQKVLISV
jgi:DNA-binding HxlR family transcriptional regulator